MSLSADLARLGPVFALDMETALAPVCFQARQARLLQLHSDTCTLTYDLLTWTQNDWDVLAAWLARPSLEVYGQNLAFDYRVLLANGVRIAGTLRDSMVASQLLHNGKAKMSHSLGEIVRRELGRRMDKTLQARNWMEVELGPDDLRYAEEDVRVTWEVLHVLHEKVAANGLQQVYELECALIPAVVDMEHHGMWLDGEVISETIEFYRGEYAAARMCFLETLDGRLQDEGLDGLPRDDDGTFNTRVKDTGSVRLGTKLLAGYNLNSAQQTLAYFKRLGIEPHDDAGKPSLDKKVLARFQSDELVRLYLAKNRVFKRQGMAEKLCEHRGEDGRIRARFMPLATGTGRFSSSSPNLQQVPRDPEFRSAFRAPAGRKLVQADYAAMELRVAAAIAQETAMLAAFAEGADIHTRTASLMFGVSEADVSKGQRQQAKATNFGALYGSGARGLQAYFATVGMFISEREAGEFRRRWHKAYPAISEWHNVCQSRALQGSPMRTMTGRRRYLYGQDNRLTTQANNLVQGTSADIMKAALVEIHRQLPGTAHLVAVVHDEIIVECDEADAQDVLALVTREMEEAAVPIIGDSVRVLAEGGVLDSWGDK